MTDLCYIPLCHDNYSNDNYSQCVCTQEFKACVDQLENFMSQNISDNDKIIIGGDCNVDMDRDNAHFRYWQEMVSRFNLKVCWDACCAKKDMTFTSNDGLSQSCIDHFYCSANIHDYITSADVISHGLNTSNHSPLKER